jgi:hypothetical protein
MHQANTHTYTSILAWWILRFLIGEIECNKDLREVEFFVCGSTPLPNALKQARQQVFAP